MLYPFISSTTVTTTTNKQRTDIQYVSYSTRSLLSISFPYSKGKMNYTCICGESLNGGGWIFMTAHRLGD